MGQAASSVGGKAASAGELLRRSQRLYAENLRHARRLDKIPGAMYFVCDPLRSRVPMLEVTDDEQNGGYVKQLPPPFATVDFRVKKQAFHHDDIFLSTHSPKPGMYEFVKQTRRQQVEQIRSRRFMMNNMQRHFSKFAAPKETIDDLLLNEYALLGMTNDLLKNLLQETQNMPFEASKSDYLDEHIQDTDALANFELVDVNSADTEFDPIGCVLHSNPALEDPFLGQRLAFVVKRPAELDEDGVRPSLMYITINKPYLHGLLPRTMDCAEEFSISPTEAEQLLDLMYSFLPPKPKPTRRRRTPSKGAPSSSRKVTPTGKMFCGDSYGGEIITLFEANPHEALSKNLGTPVRDTGIAVSTDDPKVDEKEMPRAQYYAAARYVTQEELETEISEGLWTVLRPKNPDSVRKLIFGDLFPKDKQLTHRDYSALWAGIARDACPNLYAASMNSFLLHATENANGRRRQDEFAGTFSFLPLIGGFPLAEFLYDFRYDHGEALDDDEPSCLSKDDRAVVFRDSQAREAMIGLEGMLSSMFANDGDDEDENHFEISQSGTTFSMGNNPFGDAVREAFEDAVREKVKSDLEVPDVNKLANLRESLALLKNADPAGKDGVFAELEDEVIRAQNDLKTKKEETEATAQQQQEEEEAKDEAQEPVYTSGLRDLLVRLDKQEIKEDHDSLQRALQVLLDHGFPQLNDMPKAVRAEVDVLNTKQLSLLMRLIAEKL